MPQSNEQAAIDQMTSGNSAPQQHLWMPGTVDSFAPPQEQSAPPVAAPGQQQPVQQPSTPDLNPDGKTDEEFFQELQQRTQQQQPETQEPANEIQQAGQMADRVKQLEETLLGEEAPTPETTNQPPAEQQQDAEQPEQTKFDLSSFENSFQEKYDVPLGEAIKAAKEIQTTYQQLQETSHQIDLRMQQFELMQSWGVNRKEVDKRLSQAANAYRLMNDEAKQRLRSKGTTDVEVVMYLWDALSPRQQQQQPNPTTSVPGRAAIAEEPSAQITPELISIANDDDFFRQLEQNFFPG